MGNSNTTAFEGLNEQGNNDGNPTRASESAAKNLVNNVFFSKNRDMIDRKSRRFTVEKHE